MDIKFKALDVLEQKPVITVFGVGGAGGNAVNNMIMANLGGAHFVVANTDSQALAQSKSENIIQLGLGVTKGLGAGAVPDVGRIAAEESAEEIKSCLEGSHMVFITSGMGGGTGTGSSPVIAKIAKEMGILTVGVVTKPFQFEGQNRMKTAEKGLLELQKYVDTLIVIPNQNLFRIASEKTTFAEAFKMADDVLHAGVRGITDLMMMPGLINLDFADIRAVMSEMGKAMMGTGEATGEDRAIQAAEAAISNPLLDNSSMKGANGVLINITGGPDMTLFEVDAAANRIREEVCDSEANIIFGSTFNPELNGIIRVSVVATGIDANAEKEDKIPVFTGATRRFTESKAEEAIIEEAQIPPVFNNYQQKIEEPQIGNMVNTSTLAESSNEYNGGVVHNDPPFFSGVIAAGERHISIEKKMTTPPVQQKKSLLGRMFSSLVPANEKEYAEVGTGSEVVEAPAFLRNKNR